MTKHLRGFISLLLVFVLCLGMIPSFFVTEASAASTQSSIMLFDFSDNGDYTSRLNSQLSVAYKPNGTGTTRTAYIKNLGWHFARYGNVPYADDPLYCIEPWRDYGASTSGNSVDRDITLNGSYSSTGSNVWYALPAARREAIGLILLYSDQMWDDSVSVFTTTRDNNPNVPLRVATQFLIYEIVCGLRDPSTFALNSTNECGTAGDIFYNAGAAAISNFAPNYNTLVSYVQSALQRPSFTGSSSSNAPTITLTGDETSVYDSNGVLSDWSFTDGNGAEFYKSGNYLYIYQTGTISESTVFKATKYVPSAANSTYNLWYMSGSSYQTTISLASPSYGNLYAYFKLKAPSLGNLSLTKTTEDGKNLSGWQFGIYTNSACTSLAAGPYTTNSSGKISVTGLSAGTYYVKELGHTDSSINALYYCSSTNPQKVTISAGSTASVSFTNKLNTGSLSLTKTTEDGKNLEGWKFSIYSDSACSSLVSGPHTTNSSGKISVTGLNPGTYYVKEIGHTDSSINALYYCSSTNPQPVTITAGSTASVSFENNLNKGSLKLVKTKWLGDQKKPSHRERICFAIDDALAKNPENFDALLELLHQAGYEIKQGKVPSLRGTEQRNYIRMDTLGAGYSPDELQAIIAGTQTHIPRKRSVQDTPAKPSGSLLIDIQAKLQEGKGAGYAKWAKSFNLKQMSQTMIYLEENGLLDLDTLNEQAATASATYHDLSKKIKSAEQRMTEIKILQQHIVNYSKTRNIYVGYRKAGYSKKYLAEHEADILLHKAAKKYFDDQGLEKLPTFKSLQSEYSELMAQKKAMYSDYKKAQEKMRELQTAKANADRILNMEISESEKEKTAEQR